MVSQDYGALARELGELMGLEHPALAIKFSQELPGGVSRIEGEMPAPTPDERTGKVAAGCVFWMKAEGQTFATTAEDHANCSVGSMTHGFKTLEDVAGKSDVATLVESGWVSPEMFPAIPFIHVRPKYVTYGPLQDTTYEADVVFLRLNAKQAMVLSDAWPGLRFEGKPQCHIIAIAKEQKQVAVSVGCMLSRVRTGMSSSEMTCAIPASRLAEVVDKLKEAGAADKAVAAYASEDAKRFG